MAVTAGGTPFVESSDLVANYPGASLALANRVDQVMQAPTQNAQTGTTYTAVLLDAGKTVTLSNASAVTLTIPAQATIAWVANTQLNFLNIGAGTVTITPAATVTINGTPLTLTTSQGGSLVRTASNTWTFRPSGGGGLVLVTRNTFSAESNVSVNNCFSATYQNYLMILNLQASAQAQIRLRLRSAGTDNSTAGSYIYTSAQAQYPIGFCDSSTIPMAAMSGIFNPFLASNTLITPGGVNSSTSSSDLAVPLRHNQSVSYDGFSLFPQSGTMTGTFSIYGYQNS